MEAEQPHIAVRAEPETGCLVLELSGAVTPDHLPRLVGCVRALLESAQERIVCDVAALEPDLTTVDALARLQLAARRRGLEVTLVHASESLQGLLGLCGLDEVIPPCDGLGVEVQREPEHRKDRRRVQEEHDPGDAAV
jgi:ABC-type transporter Mla MlaB component